VSILVAGEALIDFFPANCGKRRGFVPFPGGSPCNVAVGLGRLGVPVAFLGRISKDPFGQILRAHLSKSNVNLDYLSEGNEQSTISFIQLDGLKEPGFGFYGTHTVDAQLTVNLLPRMLPSEIQAIHLGSLAMIRQPSGSTLTGLMEREHGKRLISFDPNIRSDQIEDRDDYLAKLQHWIGLTDLLKVSQSDLSYLYPGTPSKVIAKEWLGLGPNLVVITHGSDGATAYTPSFSVTVNGLSVQLADTVGAGDAFSAGLLSWLYKHERLDNSQLPYLSAEELKAALTYATQIAAITCSRPGADPPWQSELSPS